MNKKKIFIALNLPEDVKNKLLRYISSEEFTHLPVFWTEKDNLHITLKFLGYANDNDVYETAELLKEIVKEEWPFDILLEKITPGPDKNEPKMIWAVGPENKSLERLYKKTSEILSGIRYENIDKKFKFKPHITLGRVGRSALENGEKIEINDKDINITFPMSSIELMESFKENGRVRYAVLQSAELHE